MREEELEVVETMLAVPEKLHIAVPGDIANEMETMEIVRQQVKIFGIEIK